MLFRSSELFSVHYGLAWLFLDESKFEDAHAHVEQAKTHVGNDVYNLGRAVHLRANLWYLQDRLEEAKPEALRAADIFNKLGVAVWVEHCRKLLRDIQKKLDSPVS